MRARSRKSRGTTSASASAERWPNIVEIGQHLVVVKAKLKHGQFFEWLQAEFAWGEQTARNLMNVATRFPNPQLVGDLKLTAAALYLLASPNVEPEAREEAIERAKVGEKIDRTSAAKIAAEAAAAKGKPPPVKVSAKRKDAEPSPVVADESAPLFTDDDIPLIEREPAPALAAATATAGPKPGVASEREVVAHDRLSQPKQAKEPAEAQPWDDYNESLVTAAEDLEAATRRITKIGQFDAKGQAHVIYADGLLKPQETIDALRDVKRALLDSRVAGKSGNRFIPERERKLAAQVAASRQRSGGAA